MAGLQDHNTDDGDEHQAMMFRARVAEQDLTHPGYREAWERFEQGVLQYGGRRVVPPMKPDLLIDLLALEAQEVDGTSAERRAGDPNDCHRNAVGLWRRAECDAIGTGYALSNDGLWREHSWGIRNSVPIETTTPRLKYYGIAMSGERATWFADWIDPK